MRIRPIRKSDRSPLLDLLRSTQAFTTEEIEIAAELIDIVLTQPSQEDYHAFAAETESDSPALAGLLIVGPVPATVGAWHMYWIAVDPEFQGKGVAQQLDRQAESAARARKAYWLIAETSGQASYERTRAFYCKQGYVQLARIPDYYKPDDDLIIFGKRLE